MEHDAGIRPSAAVSPPEAHDPDELLESLGREELRYSFPAADWREVPVHEPEALVW